MIVFAWILLICWSGGEASQPNILLILADDLGYNDVPWHNDKVIAPNLMKLAKDGVILEQHYSQPSCSPTRAALLTGRYPFHTGMNKGPLHGDVPYGLPTEFTTLADDLKQTGYSTHIVGKWHLGMCNAKYLPKNRGFDHHFGFWNGAQSYYSHKRSGLYDMHHDMEVDWKANGIYSTELFQEKASEIISKHDQANPLFLYLPFQSVHDPYEVPYHYKKIQDKSFKDDRRTFLGMITAMDEAIGNVTQTLKNANMFQNTIIIFFSDNGANERKGGRNYPLREGKFTVFEGGTRTVAFVHGPGLKPRVEKRMMHAVDWYPTLMQAAHGTPTKHQQLDGVNLWNSLRTGKGKWERNEMVYNIRPRTSKDLPSRSEPQAAIRMGDWKFIQIQMYGEFLHKKTIHNHLYNLYTDPEEKHNVAKKYPKKVEEMKSRLKEIGSTMYNGSYVPVPRPHFHSGVLETGWC